MSETLAQKLADLSGQITPSMTPNQITFLLQFLPVGGVQLTANLGGLSFGEVVYTLTPVLGVVAKSGDLTGTTYEYEDPTVVLDADLSVGGLVPAGTVQAVVTTNYNHSTASAKVTFTPPNDGTPVTQTWQIGSWAVANQGGS